MQKLTLFVFSILSFTLFSACIASNLTFRNAPAWMPAEFDAKNSILLIEAHSDLTRQERKMKAYMEKKYPYRFEFVSNLDIMERRGKYTDSKLYRFAIVGQSYSLHSMSMNRSDVPVEDFYFYDRSNGKSYPVTHKGSYSKIITFKPIINTIIKNAK